MSRYKAYPGYKDSGVNWLGMVPSQWTTCRIKNTARINPAKSEVREMAPSTQVSFIPMDAIGENGELDASRTKPISEVISGYSYVADGDIMIAKITPCFENGKGAIAKNLANGIGFATTEVINIRPNHPSDAAYFFYLLSTDPFRRLAEGAMYGAGGQKRVADSFVAEYHLFLPELFERTKISVFLDHETAKIDALIEKQQRLIELLKEKRQAVISHAVTKGLNPNAPMKYSGVEWLGKVPAHWAVGKCGFHVSILSGYAFQSFGFSDNDEDTKLLRGINVGVNSLKWNEVVYWRRKPSDGLDAYVMQEGDIVIGMDRPLISEGIRVAKVKETLHKSPACVLPVSLG
jgi:type I restriction enzyme, S subunit